jgi:hypothetical protein
MDQFRRDLHEQIDALDQTILNLHAIGKSIAAEKSYVLKHGKTCKEVGGDLQEQVGYLTRAIVRLQEIKAFTVGAKLLATSTGEMTPTGSTSPLGYVPHTIFCQYAYPWFGPTTANLAVRQRFTSHFEYIVTTKYPVEARKAIEPHLIELRELALEDDEIEYCVQFGGYIDKLFNATFWKSYSNLNALFFEDKAVAAFLDENHVCPNYSFVNRAPIQ